MKKLVFALLLFFTYQLNAQFRCQDIKQELQQSSVNTLSINNNAKSDTIDILHYNIELDLYSIASQQLKGSCTIVFTPKLNNISQINLDLLELNIDSILLNGTTLGYSYNDTIIHVNLAGSYKPGDTLSLEVNYHGQPQGDASGWGGFHFQSGYYYNLGVGFAANPHTYGRAWFPCFDNFVEKSTYHFTATTQFPNKAYFNGTRLLQTSVGGDTLLTEWDMTDPIPTYLTSVAVSNYEEVHQTVNGMDGVKPIMLMAKASDTTTLKNSFQNLIPAFHALEHYFGPYVWQKIGYAVTTKGAMEHATSIHYPISLVNGNLGGEDIMAHELAHHWWGNLLTCKTAEDMWINEGMAEFSSHLYLEQVYDRARYLDEVMKNAYNVLKSAHTQDDGYKAISGLGHNYVYGYHVYQKGAMVAHNLRAYMGDSAFFPGLQTLLNNNAFGNLNTLEFRDQLQQISGIGLQDFFDDWVLKPGFPSFAIDSIYVPSFSQTNTAYVRVAQNTHHAPGLFSQVPVDITFFSANRDTVSRHMIVNGSTSTATFNNLPFQPVFALCSYNGRLLTADTYDQWTLGQRNIYIPEKGGIRFNSDPGDSTAEVICMQHWAAPKGKVSAGKDYRVSQSRFWTLQGYDLDTLENNTEAIFYYDGSSSGYDQDLAGVSGDSIVILYRAKPWEPWTLWQNQVRKTNNISGVIEVLDPKPGDYVLANTAEKIGLKNEPAKQEIDIYPNPSHGTLNIKFNEHAGEEYTISINDAGGKLIYQDTVQLSQNTEVLEVRLPKTKAQFVTVTVGSITQKILLK
ncbi:MAG: hypothetical protein CMI35_10510 [Owenweeksia sp.]|mgnify:CR=1 FL=1|nr:hypothetical protein [Owenweeksia sp.]|tara:strand:- start:938 stop:3319 length:2382 start_codon:yes stop_codon:yes gene_type:complete